MSALYSDAIIDEIREKCNIAEIVGNYIPLKRAGRNFKAVCPFHPEKTPSFMVSPAKGIFHCFGCGAGGNVFNFVMKYEGLEFPQVLKMLAQKAGVKLPVAAFTAKKEKASTDLFGINEMAASWFHHNLKKDIGAPALRYLKKRDYQAKTILSFKLGYAPEANGLLQFMKARGISEQLLERAGLILRKERGTSFDRFRQRLMFPIFDTRGRVLAFGGRVLGDAQPKYMNSPETPVYNKGSHLYGLNLAKEEIKKNDFCIIVEGYLDLLTVQQNGIGNVVASLGTALTPVQIRLLKRFTKKVVVIFDADRAGEMASLRSLDLLIEEDMNVKVVSLPENEDPDSFIRSQGKDKFWKHIVNSADLFDYKLRLLTKSFNMETVEGKVGIAGHMLPTIKRVQNEIRKGAYVKRLAQEFSRGEKSLGEEWILAELKKVKKDFEQYSPQTVVKRQVKAKRPAEEMVLRIALESEDSIKEIKERLSIEDFQDVRIREIIRIIFRENDNQRAVNEAKIISSLENDDTAALIARICSQEATFDNMQRALIDCIERIKTDNHKDKLNRLQREIKLAQSWGHKDRIVELVGKYNTLMKGQGIGK